MKTWKQFLTEADNLAGLPRYDANRPAPKQPDPAEIKSKVLTLYDRLKQDLGELPAAAVSIFDDLLTALTGSPTAPF